MGGGTGSIEVGLHGGCGSRYTLKSKTRGDKVANIRYYLLTDRRRHIIWFFVEAAKEFKNGPIWQKSRSGLYGY